MKVVAQFDFESHNDVIPKRPRFYQRAEGSPVAHSIVAGDPSLRLKNGCAQDDAIIGKVYLDCISIPAPFARAKN